MTQSIYKSFWRTYACGQLNSNYKDQYVYLSGWVDNIRFQGSIAFVDLRDRSGIVQLIFFKKGNPELFAIVKNLTKESVINVGGMIVLRKDINPEMSTGTIEIAVDKLNMLSESKPLPFDVMNREDGPEELRHKYRYLDLRSEELQHNLKIRNSLTTYIRHYMQSYDFLDIETPTLIKSTPEGARDFLVPSRLYEGKFYALPQSPQLFKQLLMVAGYDRYFQIARCYRDESLRADRQLEFTQIDCEMSFVAQRDVMQFFSDMISNLFNDVADIDISKIDIMSYEQAMTQFGSDKPDLRWDKYLDTVQREEYFFTFLYFEDLLSLEDIRSIVEFSDLKKSQMGLNDLYVSICDTNHVNVGYEFLDNPAKGKSYIVIRTEYFNMDSAEHQFMGDLRNFICKNMIPMNREHAPLWVVDFPMFVKDKETGNLTSVHHPFTMPSEYDIDKLNSDNEAILLSMKSAAYDFVLNGVEVGGGSMRIYNKEIQQKVFDILKLTKEQQEDQFGFLLKAFDYGVPPHAGIAFGLDRLCTFFGKSDNIKDYIAFPKNMKAVDPMCSSPSYVDEAQLKELFLKIEGTVNH